MSLKSKLLERWLTNGKKPKPGEAAKPVRKDLVMRFEHVNSPWRLEADIDWWAPAALLNALTGDAVSRLAVPSWRAQVKRKNDALGEEKEELGGPLLDWRKHFHAWRKNDDGDAWGPYRVTLGHVSQLGGNGQGGAKTRPLRAFQLFEDQEGLYDPLREFYWTLARITDLKVARGDKKKGKKKKDLKKVTQEELEALVAAELEEFRDDGEEATFLNGVHRRTLTVLEYYDRYTPTQRRWAHRMPIRLMEEQGYDFILHDRGIDLFLPPEFEAPRDLQSAILQHYKHRASGPLPMGLPLRGKGGPTPIINIGPDGASQGSPQWMEAVFSSVNPPKWWVTGDVYRDILTAIPRVIAAIWHEAAVYETLTEVRDKDVRLLGDRKDSTYLAKINIDPRDGFKTLVQERIETRLPEAMDLRLVDPVALEEHLPDMTKNWDYREPMITSKGIWIADPGPPPPLAELLEAIERGNAGNPVFTHTWPCA